MKIKGLIQIFLTTGDINQ